MKTKLVIFAASFISFSAIAEPVYLDCQIDEKEGITKFSVKLDEQTNKITHTYDTGSAFNTEGFFSANTVSYKRVQIFGSQEAVSQYEINRENLSLTYSFSAEPINKELLGKVTPINSTSPGSCKVIKQSPKAF